MIPALLAQDVAQSLREFIITGFETNTWPFAGKFEQLVNPQNESGAFIKGPYVSISLPFAKQTDRTDYFKEQIESKLNRPVRPRLRGGDRKSRVYQDKRKINRV